jgi:HK97 family phage prohead protease
MPWSVSKDDRCPTSRPFGVVKDDDNELEGCHESEEAAKAQQRALYAREEPQGASSDLQKKTFDLIEVKADEERGTFTALASVFGNVDLGGDKMVKGAFKNTLEKWRKSGRSIPVILSHQWDSLTAYVGKADPRAVYEDDRGLMVQGQLFMDKEAGRDVYRLMKEGLLTGWSFGYKVPAGGQKKNGKVNEVTEVDLFEVGPTLVGMNPEAQLQEVKKQAEPDAIVTTLTGLFESKMSDESKEKVIAAAHQLAESTSSEASEHGTNEEPQPAKSRPRDALKERSAAAVVDSHADGVGLRKPSPPPKHEEDPELEYEALLKRSRAAVLDELSEGSITL